MLRLSYLSGVSQWLVFGLFVFLSAGCGGGSGSANPIDRQTGQNFQSQGAVSVSDEHGAPYAMKNAYVSVSDIDQVSAQIRTGKSRENIVVGASMVDSQGQISLALPSDKIFRDRLYVVEIRCQTIGKDCELKAPLHVVLSGSELQHTQWSASILTELTYRYVAYYVAAEYGADELRALLDTIANWILVKKSEGRKSTYADVLAWSGAVVADQVKKPELLQDLIGQLANKVLDANDWQEVVRAMVTPVFSHLESNAPIYSITPVGDYAYVAAGKGGLEILDIRDETSPTTLSNVVVPGYVVAVNVVGEYAYVLYSDAEPGYMFPENFEGESGFVIVDVANKKSPLILDKVVFKGVGSDIVVEGDRAYVSYYDFSNNGAEIVNNNSGFIIFDVSKPETIDELTRFDSEYYPTSLEVINKIIYLLTFDGNDATANSSFSMIMAESINDVREVGHIDFKGSALDFAMKGGLVFIASGFQGLTILDVKTNVSMVEIETADTAYFAKEIVLDGDLVYLADAMSTVQVVNVENIYQPSVEKKFLVDGRIFGLSHQQDTLFVANGSTRTPLLDLDSLPDKLPSEGLELAGDNVSIATKDDVVYMIRDYVSDSANHGELNIIDVANKIDPRLLGEERVTGFLHELTIDRNRLFVSDYDYGLHLYDISNPTQPKLDLTSTALKSARQLNLVENLLYVTSYLPAVNIVDINDPDAITEEYVSFKAEIENSSLEGDTADGFAGRYLGVATSGNYFLSLDTSVPTSPRLLDYIEISGITNAVVQQGDFVYLAGGQNGYYIIGTSDPRNLTIEANGRDFYDVKDLVVYNNYLYVADFAYGLFVFDVSNPKEPNLIGNAATLGQVTSIVAGNGYVYLATTYGLEIFKAVQRD